MSQSLLGVFLSLGEEVKVSRSYAVRFILQKDGEVTEYIYQPVKGSRGYPEIRIIKEGQNKEEYKINKDENGNVQCTCPGFKYKKDKGSGVRCKHFDALLHFGRWVEEVFAPTLVRS